MSSKTTILEILTIPLWIILLPIILVIILLALLQFWFQGLILRIWVRFSWLPKGKRLLFVYSEGPHWKEHIEKHILPKIKAQAVVINWSERSKWDWEKKPLELKVFQHWTGVQKYQLIKKVKWDGNDFNPVAITFIPWYKPKVFRFWQPFRDFKHGKKQALEKLEKDFFDILNKKYNSEQK